jgi:hypothetical protein
MSFPAGPLWLIGCGNMGGAMLNGWIAAGLDPASVTVITRSGKGAPDGVRSLTALPDEDAPTTLMLALKPQQIDAAQALLEPLRGPISPARSARASRPFIQPARQTRRWQRRKRSPRRSVITNGSPMKRTSTR